MDIKVTCGTTTDRQAVIVSNTLTPKDALNQSGISYGSAQIHLDGSPLSATEVNTSFADLSITSDCMLIAVTKTTNA